MASVSQAAVVEPRFSVGYRGWLLGLLITIYACSFLDRVIVSTVGPAIISELRLSDFQFGLLAGPAFAIFYVVFGIPIARAAERSSRINIIAICIALWSLMTAACGLSQTFWQLLLFRMGVGVGEGGCSPAAHSLLSDHFPPKLRASAIAIYSAGVPLGVMVGAVLGGWIAQHFNWRTAFVVVGLPGLILAILAKLTLREPERGRLEAAAPSPDAPPLVAVLKRLGSSPTVLLLVGGLVLANLAGSSMAAFTQTYLVRAFHLGLAKVGLLYGLVVGVGGTIGMSAGGVVADVLGKRDVRWYGWAPAIGTALGFPLYLLAYSQHTAEAAVAFIFVAYLFVALYFAPAFGVVQNLVEPRMRASASALLFLAINIVGQGIGPTVMGLASDMFAAGHFGLGSYHALCPAIRGAPAQVAAACASASAAGLQQSIRLSCSCFLAASVLYWLASGRLRRDISTARPI